MPIVAISRDRKADAPARTRPEPMALSASSEARGGVAKKLRQSSRMNARSRHVSMGGGPISHWPSQAW
jgi:hypothetical protein